MKKLVIAGIVFLFVGGAALFFTMSNLGPLVKKAVNTAGPSIVKTDIAVSDVNVSLFSGEAQIKDFILGNPEGFSSDPAMTVGSIYVDVEESTITQTPIVINRIEIVAPQITYEKKLNTDNFNALLENIRGSAEAEKSPAPEEKDQDQQARKLVINHLIVRDGGIRLAMAVLGGKTICAPLPDIHLKDIGKEKDGTSPAEAAEQIFASLYDSINADSVTTVFNDGLSQLGKLKNHGASGVQAGIQAASGAVDTAAKGVGSAAEGLKKLFE